MDLFLVVAFILTVSFISNVSPFFGASYTLLATLQLTLLGFSPFHFVVVVFASAIGATLAKVGIYYGAFGFKNYLIRNKNVRLIGKNASTGKFFVVLFVTALLPVLPLDDFIYIGAGASAASVGLMASVTLLAKVVKSAFEVAIEFTILRDVGRVFGFNSVEATVVLSALFLVIGIGLYKLDWESTYAKIRGRAPVPTQSPEQASK